MIKLEKDDLVQLKNGEIVEIVNDNDIEPFMSFTNTGEIIRFKYLDIECIKKAKLEPCGGDNINYWLFYTGPGYQNTTKESIANWAKFVLKTIFSDLSLDQIMSKHIYWATESSNFKSYYNGDTYILYTTLSKLPESMQYDAQL